MKLVKSNDVANYDPTISVQEAKQNKHTKNQGNLPTLTVSYENRPLRKK